MLYACPDCRSVLQTVEIERLRCRTCERCRIVFPDVDGIHVLLPSSGRSARIEGLALEALAAVAARRPAIGAMITNTRDLLDRAQSDSWAWEDEVFWSAEYQHRLSSGVSKNWNDRNWQRQFLVDALRRDRFDIHGKTILDVGAGEGQTFRALLEPRCDSESKYIAVDISLAGLRLNRALNKHPNSEYVLALASHLPIPELSVDLLCYFGVMHHLDKGERAVADHLRLVKGGGYILIDEALLRPRALGRLSDAGHESAHEGRIARESLAAVVRGLDRDVEVRARRYFYTVVYGAALRLGSWLILRSRRVFEALLLVDRVALLLLGPFLGLFSAGEILLVLRKRAIRASMR